MHCLLDVFSNSTLTETNIAPENRVSQKENSSCNHWLSGDMLVVGSLYTLSFAVLILDSIRIGRLRRQASRVYYGSLVSTMLSCFGRHSYQLLYLSQWIPMSWLFHFGQDLLYKLFRASQATRLRPGSDQTRIFAMRQCTARIVMLRPIHEHHRWRQLGRSAGSTLHDFIRLGGHLCLLHFFYLFCALNST